MTAISIVIEDDSKTDTVRVSVSNTNKTFITKEPELLKENSKIKTSVNDIYYFFNELTSYIKEDNEYRVTGYLDTPNTNFSPHLFIRDRLQHFFYSLTQDLKIDNKYRI